MFPTFNQNRFNIIILIILIFLINIHYFLLNYHCFILCFDLLVFVRFLGFFKSFFRDRRLVLLGVQGFQINFLVFVRFFVLFLIFPILIIFCCCLLQCSFTEEVFPYRWIVQ